MPHTPGPWKLDPPSMSHVTSGSLGEGYHAIVAGQGSNYRGLHGFTITQFMGVDDARLIAAAPDLLAALKSLDDCYCEVGPDLTKVQRHQHRLALIAARAAIAKATGAST